MNPNEQAIEAFEAMMKGSQFVTINGDADWHTIQMPNRDALNKAAAALAALKAHQQAAQDVELPPLPEAWIEDKSHADPASRLHFAADQMHDYARAAIAAHQARQAVPQVDRLAQIIRTVDGSHTLGAGALAEKIVESLAAAPTPEATQPTQANAGLGPLWPNGDRGRGDLPPDDDGYGTAPQAEAPTPAPEVVANFRTESDGLVGTTSAKVHAVSWADDGALVVEIDYWPQPTQAEAPGITDEQIDTLLSDWARNAGNHWDGDVLRTGGFVTKNDLRQLVLAALATQAACIACGKASGHESWCARQRWGIGQTTQAEALNVLAMVEDRLTRTGNIELARQLRLAKAAIGHALATHPAPEQVELDGIVSDAMRRYLRVCSSGGMPLKQIKTVQANVDEAERLGYFKQAIAKAILADREAQATKGGEA